MNERTKTCQPRRWCQSTAQRLVLGGIVTWLTHPALAQDAVVQRLEQGVVVQSSPQPPTGPPPGAPGQPPNATPGQPGQPGTPNQPPAAPATGATPAAPVTRPAQPPDNTNAEAFKVRPNADGMIEFQFHGATWPPLIDWLGDITGLSVDWQELPGDYVNLHTQRPYTVAETRDLINRHLLARGYTILPDGDLLAVVKTAGINTAMVPRVTPQELATCRPHDFVKVSFELDWLIAENLVAELKPMMSSNGQLTALKTTNRVEAVDAARNLQQVYAVIAAEQSPDSQNRLLKEFLLEHVRATQIKEKIEQLLGIAQKPQPQLSPEMQQQQQMMMMQMQQQAMQQGQQNPQANQQKPAEIKILINEQRNSVIAQCPPDKMVIVAQAIQLLDVPDRRRESLDALVGSIKTYRLATLTPQDVVGILMETGALDPDTRIKVDEQSRSLVVTGPPWDHMIVDKLIKKLDGSPRQFKTIRLRHRSADQVAATIEGLMVGQKEEKKNNRRSYYDYFDFYGGGNREQKKSDDAFRVAADVEHNWILLWCNEKEHEHVIELLRELGEIPKLDARANQVRVIDAIDPQEADEVLRRAREALAPLLPNPVYLPEPLPAPSAPAETEAPDVESRDKEKTDTPVKGLPPGTEEAQKEPPTSSPTPKTEDVGQHDHRDMSMWLARHDLAVDTTDHDAVGNSAAVIRTVAMETDGDEAADAETTAPERATGDEDAGDGGRRAPPKTPEPIVITRTEDGKLVIRSNDPAALEAFSDLVERLRPQQRDYAVFKLNYASASWVVLQLEDFFEEDDKDDKRPRYPFWYYDDFGSNNNDDKNKAKGLAERRPIRFISDNDTSTIVVRDASASQLKTVADLVKLYDVPEPVSNERSRHTQLIYVKHSKASLIAAQIKDAFRDLLSGNDKAFEQAQQPQQQQQQENRGGFSMGFEFGEGKSKTQSDTRASFKGKLSIGIDDVTNTLLVSTEGEALLKVIVTMITRLDEAAKPVDNVRVVRLRRGSAYREVQDALRRTLGIQGESRGVPAPKGPAAPATPDAKKPNGEQKPDANQASKTNDADGNEN